MNKDIDIDIIEQSKKIAAYTAVDEFIKDNMVVGIGSGSTITYAIQRLEERTKKEGLKVVCIPSSFQSSHLILKSSLTIGDLERYPQIDVTIDGADEVDEHLNLMKGGGGCQTQEKIVAFNAKVYVIIADYRKQSKILGEKWKNGVPIEVVPVSYMPIMKILSSKFGGKPKLRMAVNKAGPVITDNGFFILDVDFGLIENPTELNFQLKQLPGVLETGLFINMVDKVFFGQPDGSIITIDKNRKTTIIKK